MTGWRTIAFNVVSLIVLLLNNYVAAAPWIPPAFAEYGLIIGNIVLRYLTTTPIGEPAK